MKATYTKNLTLPVGSWNIFQNKSSQKSSIKLYDLQCYSNEVLVRNFIPCFRKSDEEIGLYDIINGEFYTNQGTGKFKRSLIEGEKRYQALEYIESTGTQYIDTGVVTKDTINFEIDTKYIGGGSNTALPIFGSRTTGGSSLKHAIWIQKTTNYVGFNFGGIDTGYLSNTNMKERQILKNFGPELYYNDSLIYSGNEQSFSSDLTLTLFALNTNSGINNRQVSMDLYSCKIWDNGKLVRDFIPCYDKLEDKYGLYDLVENKFYENKGTGDDFTPGPPVDIEIGE